MKTRENRFSIRKLSVGASSIVVATLLFMGGGSAQAAEKQQEVGTPDTASAQSIGDNDTPEAQKGQVQSVEQAKHDVSQIKNENKNQTSLHNELHQTDASKDHVSSNETHQPSTEESEKSDSNTDNQQTEVTSTSQQTHSTETPTSKTTTNEVTSTEHAASSEQDERSLQSSEPSSKTDDSTKKVTPHTESQVNQTSETKQADLNQPHSNTVKSKDTSVSSNDEHSSKSGATEQQQSTQSTQSKDDNQQAPSPLKDNHQSEALKATTPSQQQTITKKEATTTQASQDLNTEKGDHANISIDAQTNPFNNDNPSKQDKDAQSGLNTLKNNSVATTNTQSKSQAASGTKDQTNKVAKQAQYKNQDPIILVHGFSGFTDDISPSVLAHYWGGDKLNIRQDLEENGYESYEASISAFGSNYDRAVELYYYIKGGTVDYGAAHAAKYGHERYGKTYEGVYKDWQPGQKVHLVGHSMGGQTIRQLEALLRNGNPEEQEYQRVHGGDISPLYQGQHDNMISSITTLGTPHNGTHASDLLGNEALIRQIVFDAGKVLGNKDSRVDFGLSQWGLKQQPNESYIDYAKRVKDSKLWQTKDNGFYDLTREGATNLNRQTSLNPNIVYKTYTGESTHASLFGRQKSDLNLYFPFTLTANVIGKVAEKEWRENDGLVSVISSQHPFNQAFTQATDTNQKGIWQVTPTKHDWDHIDFVGQDSSDTKRTRAELQQFWHSLADDLVQSESLTREV